MPVHRERVTIATSARVTTVDITSRVRAVVARSAMTSGICTVVTRHTTTGVFVNENADPDVQRDLEEFFRRLVPASDDPSMSWIVHTTEGPDDMPAHIRAALTAVSLSIPVTAGRLALGQWQGIYLFEHRDGAHRRHVVAHLTV